MKILLDTASIDEVKWATDVGIVDGISTDPTLIAEEDSTETYHELLAELCRLTRGPVLAPVLAITADDIYRDGKELAKIADNGDARLQRRAGALRGEGGRVLGERVHRPPR